MELEFVDSDFEPGMCFLVETLADCIENQKHGWISKKFGKFSIHFIFNGLNNSRDVKRNGANDLCVVPTKIRKLNTSSENLMLVDCLDEPIDIRDSSNSDAACSSGRWKSHSNNNWKCSITFAYDKECCSFAIIDL